MVREERYEFRYRRNEDEGEKVCYPRSKERMEANRRICKERGYKVISVKKLYPFSTERNQHNFDLISSICQNRMHDMRTGEESYDESEYQRLSDTAYRAQEFFCLPLPVAWLPYEQWQEAKELALAAEIHRDAANARARY